MVVFIKSVTPAKLNLLKHFSWVLVSKIVERKTNKVVCRKFGVEKFKDDMVRNLFKEFVV